jgi:hypothetical protein
LEGSAVTQQVQPREPPESVYAELAKIILEEAERLEREAAKAS